MPVAIVTDTCHYLGADVVRANDIHEVSLYVHRGEEVLRESEISDLDAYYSRLGTETELPTTSQPSIGDFLAVYEPLLDAGHEIVSIHLAGGMSGTVRSAEQARAQLGERAELVHVIDSESACGGQGLMVLAGCAAARAGADGATVADHVRRAPAGPAAVVCHRHARISAPRRADRRRAGLARDGAEDQADPHRPG